MAFDVNGNERELSARELGRYSRHLLLADVGLSGQLKLKRAKVLIVGMGGLGAPISLYLAAAGVGTLGLVDFDRVERSNLQRQILYSEADVGELKVTAAARRLNGFNADVNLRQIPEIFTAEVAVQLVPEFDIVIDGTDNFATRYLLNDVCVWNQKPCVHGSVFQFEGQTSVFWASQGPCYRCLFPEPPPPEAAPNCSEAGVLGVLPGQIAMFQATETIKLILGIGQSLVGRLLRYDALSTSIYEIKIPKDPDCPVCGDAPTITEPIDYQEFCNGRKQREDAVEELSVEAYQALAKTEKPPFLVDIRRPDEWAICQIPGSHFWTMDSLDSWADKLPPDRMIVITCRSGVRGAKTVAELLAKGNNHVKNLKGGVLAWIEAFDPQQPGY